MPTYKYTLKSGKTMWYAAFNYTDWTGKSRHTCKRGFQTQREAKEYERAFLDQQSVSSDLLFSSLVENYLEDMQYRLKPTTMIRKRNIIKNLILPYFSSFKVCDIDTVKIRKWQNELLSFRNSKGKPYAPTYLKGVHGQLSTIMNYAVNHYRLRSNPCRTAGSIGKSKANKMSIWTQEEYEHFSSYLKKPAVKLAFDILFYTGIRSGELLALTPADILPDKHMKINKNYVRIQREDLFVEPKTPKSDRIIALPDFLYDDIQKYISQLYGIKPTDRIFYFTNHLLLGQLKRNAKAAGLKQIRVHDLRHSHASMLINMNFDIVEISERLGHESPKTTLEIYSHLYPGKDKNVASALNKLRQTENPADASGQSDDQ